MAKKNQKDNQEKEASLKAMISDTEVCRFILNTQTEMRLDGNVNKKNIGVVVACIVKHYIQLLNQYNIPPLTAKPK